MSTWNWLNSIYFWPNRRINSTQPGLAKLAKTERALYDSEQLRRELQEEIEVRKQVQFSLQNTTNVLARRTTELQTRTLELEKRNQELDAFAQMVAHDLKNPLSGIVAMTSLVLETTATGIPLNAKSLAQLRLVQQSAQKSIDIVEAMLLLAGISRCPQVPMQFVEVSQVLNNVIQLRLANLIEQSQAVLHLPKYWPAVESYAPWLEEVWSNYISNALKYSGTPPVLELGARLENDGIMVRFWVRDNGYGLTPKEQLKLFTPFTRLHKKSVDGHGLGLSIVRQIVEKLGGEVGVVSLLGQGSCFYFKLPARPSVMANSVSEKTQVNTLVPQMEF